MIERKFRNRNVLAVRTVGLIGLGAGELAMMMMRWQTRRDNRTSREYYKDYAGDFSSAWTVTGAASLVISAWTGAGAGAGAAAAAAPACCAAYA